MAYNKHISSNILYNNGRQWSAYNHISWWPEMVMINLYLNPLNRVKFAWNVPKLYIGYAHFWHKVTDQLSTKSLKNVLCIRMNLNHGTRTFSPISVCSPSGKMARSGPNAHASSTSSYRSILRRWPNKILFCRVVFCSHASWGTYASLPWKNKWHKNTRWVFEVISLYIMNDGDFSGIYISNQSEWKKIWRTKTKQKKPKTKQTS